MLIFIPLKGSVVRDLYPERWMRTSADIDLLIREDQEKTCEELLIDKSQIEILCPLDGRQGPKMRIVWAYLGKIHDYKGTFSKDEVDHVFTVPLSFFLENEPTVYKMKNICEAPKDFPITLLQNKVYRWELKDFVIPVYKYAEEYIWGFTARNIIGLVNELKA